MADLWGEARRHALEALAAEPNQRIYRLLAAIEQREQTNPEASLRWLEKAAYASHEAMWVCDDCGGAIKEWQAACHSCGAFDRFTWRSPSATHARSAYDALGDVIPAVGN